MDSDPEADPRPPAAEWPRWAAEAVTASPIPSPFLIIIDYSRRARSKPKTDASRAGAREQSTCLY